MAKIITTVDKCLILSATSYTLSETSFTGYDETMIYTNDCSFASSNEYVVKAKALQFHTSRLTVLSDRATISISGKAGTNNQSPTDKQADGGDAYDLALSSAKFDQSNSSDGHPLKIIATGGNGADGYTFGGKGGNGGNGGTVSLIFNDTCQNAALDLRLVRKSSEGDIDKVKLGTWLEIQMMSIHQPPDLVTAIQKLSTSYMQMPMDALLQAVDDLEDLMLSESNNFMASVSVDTSGGSYGVGGQERTKENPVPGPIGVPGRSGRFNKHKMLPSVIQMSKECLFHPEQVAMTLREAENQYFCGTKESLSACQGYLSSLITRLSFLDTLLPSDNLFKAYKEKEAEMFVVPSGALEPTSITTLKSCYNQAQQYASQLQRGLDFYGRDRRWVPKGSLDFYKGQLEGALKDFATLEKNYMLYETQAKDDTLRKSQLEYAMASANYTLDQAVSDMTRLQTEADNAAGTIAVLQDRLPDKRAALMKALKDAEDKIKNNFSVSFSDFISAASQFAFAPGIPMGVIQGVGLLNSGINKVTDDSGLTVQKDYVISQLVELGKGMDGLAEGVQIVQGGMDLDDPGATKLIGDESNIMDLVSNYRGLLGKDTLQDIRSSFDDYIAAVLQRNSLVLHYNASLNLWLKARATRDESQATKDLLGKKQLTEIHTEIPALAVAIEKGYFSTASVILRLLHDTCRTLAFWSLSGSNTSVLENIRTAGFPSADLSNRLTAARDTLIDQYSTDVENFSSARQPFGITTESDLDPIKVKLTSAQRASLCTLSRDSYGIILSIPEAYPKTKRAVNPFAGCADVRISGVRFYLKGAKTADDELTVTLTHLGQSTIVDSSGLDFHFSQNAFPTKFQYNLQTGKIGTPGDIVTIMKNDYALPSPFASWRIEISQDWNDTVDLSQVTDAWFEFSGSSRVFR